MADVNLCIKVEASAGAKTGVIAVELAELAEKLSVVVEAVVQEATMIARPGQTWADVHREWERDCRLANYPQS